MGGYEREPNHPMKNLFKDLTWKFMALTALMVTTVMLAEQSLLMKQTRVGMESRLAEKAAFINTFYAFLIADSLQRKDDVTLQQVINRLEDDPEITSVVVVDNKGEIRYHTDPEKLGLQLDDAAVKKASETGEGTMTPFQNSGGRALALVSPLKVQGHPKPTGVVKIEFTYKHVQDQISKFDSSFKLAMLGFISAACGFILIFVKKWVTRPIEVLETNIKGLHMVTAEANLPEAEGEFGLINKALNEMVTRFRAEMQDQMGGGPSDTEMERDLVEHLMAAFLPKTRIIVADKDNRVLSDMTDGQPAATSTAHILDLITDINFANLVGAAYQSVGVPAVGSVMVQDHPYNAAVLCLPSSQSKLVKAVIALQAPMNKGESST